MTQGHAKVLVGLENGVFIAKKIIDDWSNFRPKFLKVMPTEYRRALEEIKAEKLANIEAAE